MAITKKQLKISVSIIIAISAIILIFVLFAGKKEPVPQASKNKTITAKVPAAAKLSPVALVIPTKSASLL